MGSPRVAPAQRPPLTRPPLPTCRPRAGESAVAAWEDGTEPLADISYPLLQQLEAALTAASADPSLIADLVIGTWCDLVLAALATEPTELLCLMSDPLAAEPAFGELLTWAAEDHRRPERYRPYAGPGPLLRNADRGCVAAVIRLRETGRSAGRRAA